MRARPGRRRRAARRQGGQFASGSCAARASRSRVTTLAQLQARPEELVEYLFRDNSFPNGVLLAGTGIRPPGDSLAAGDEIRIEIAGVGRLVSTVGA